MRQDIQKKLHFRVDANKEIATGHAMRCMAIAQAAEQFGISCEFIVADKESADFIESKGFSCHVMKSVWNDMESELLDMVSYIQQEKVSHLLIDSYYVTEHYMEILNQYIKTAYIDDIGTYAYVCDMLICYAVYYEQLEFAIKYARKGGKMPTLLLGTKYVPVRQAFANIPTHNMKQEISSVLLLSGGNDKFGILERILTEVRERLDETVSIEVVCGKYFKGYMELVEKYEQIPNIHLYQQIENIENFMLQADVAISAGGTSLYELCICQTPTVCFELADNQRGNTKAFEKWQCMLYAGDMRCPGTEKKVVDCVEKYCESSKLRQKHMKNMRQMVDGRGAERIVKEFLDL